MLISKFQSSSDKCDSYEFIPLYKKYCFAIKLDGRLVVDYFYESKNR